MHMVKSGEDFRRLSSPLLFHSAGSIVPKSEYSLWGARLDDATRQPYLMLPAKSRDHVRGTAVSLTQPSLTLYVFAPVPESAPVTPQIHQTLLLRTETSNEIS